MCRWMLGVAAIRRGRRLLAICRRIVVIRGRRIDAIRGRVIGISGRRRIVAIRRWIIDIGHNIAAAVQATPIANLLDWRGSGVCAVH
jgi:hypothetical protein